jgi:hypothetical protein
LARISKSTSEGAVTARQVSGSAMGLWGMEKGPVWLLQRPHS